MEDEIIFSAWPEWKAVKKLGQGSYGAVYEAVRIEHSIETKAAIKVITIPQNESELDSLRAEGFTEDDTRKYLEGVVNDFVSEIQLMDSFKGVQNIVSVEDYKVIEEKDGLKWTIYIRMELLTPFNSYISGRTLSEEEIIKLGTDMCSALELCEKRDVIHRDIKPENIFVNQFGDFKLGDFGIARKLGNVTGGLSQKGTFNYMAPEVEKGGDYDRTVDLYSLGLVLYRLLNNNLLPFLTQKGQLSPNERMAAVRKRLDGEKLLPPANSSEVLSGIILKATEYEPSKRYKSASEMKQALMNITEGKTSYNEEDDPLNKTMAVRRAAGASVKPEAGSSAGIPASEPEMKREVSGRFGERGGTPDFTQGSGSVELFGGKISFKMPSKKVLIGIAAALCAIILMIVLIPGKDGEDKETPAGISGPAPTEAPEPAPTEAPEPAPTEAPEPAPTEAPEPAPTETPEPAPTEAPEPAPTEAPEPAPTETPEPAPTEAPKPAPTEAPEPAPTETPEPAPTEAPEPAPTKTPRPAPTRTPSPAPTMVPTPVPTLPPVSEIISQVDNLIYLGHIREAEALLSEAESAYPDNAEIKEKHSEVKKRLKEAVYLFDYNPTDVEGAYLCMMNNDFSRSYSWYDEYGNFYSYTQNWKMQSNGKTYKKGMALTVMSDYVTKITVSNMIGQFKRMTGMVAFEDKYIERVGKAYEVEFYADDELVKSIKIRKNSKPTEFDIDINYCEKLVIVLRMPDDDYSYNPNINLLDFKLYY
ncbi:MAG: protein kinase [Lachnospiraceae bacterium]|nr:protein kinase [Lachnospiraceae bacterium]